MRGDVRFVSFRLAVRTPAGLHRGTRDESGTAASPRDTNLRVASDISSCETNIRLAGRPTADHSPKSSNIEHSLAPAHLYMDNRDSIGVYGGSMGLYMFYRDKNRLLRGC